MSMVDIIVASIHRARKAAPSLSCRCDSSPTRSAAVCRSTFCTMNSFIAAALICLVSLSASAEGLKCYVCGGNACADPYSSTGEHETTCTPDMATKSVESLKSAANKISNALGALGINTESVDLPNVKLVCVRLEVKSGENKVVTRSCAAATDKNDVCDALKGENTVCSSCDSDLCNGATAAHLSIALMAITALLIASYAH